MNFIAAHLHLKFIIFHRKLMDNHRGQPHIKTITQGLALGIMETAFGVMARNWYGKHANPSENFSA